MRREGRRCLETNYGDGKFSVQENNGQISLGVYIQYVDNIESPLVLFVRQEQ